RTTTPGSPRAPQPFSPPPCSLQRLHFPEIPPPGTEPAPPGRPLAAHFSGASVPGGPRGRFRGRKGVSRWRGLVLLLCPGQGPRWRGPRAETSSPRGSSSSCDRLCSSSTLTSTPSGLVPLCRESQVELREQIDNLASELCRINEDQKVALDLDPYVKKLLNARRRVVLVNNILQNAQERLRRLNHSVAKETARRRAMLDSGVYPPGSPSK
uniref:Biogenesis of lysosome-related organelles complex 1 subunit 7 n=1 Tax=Equus asinus TaxID=9793 RepID=A0A8C4KSP1_EQUAS